MTKTRKLLLIASAVFLSALLAGIIFFARVIPRTTPDHGIISPTSGKIISIFDTHNPNVVFEKQGITNHVTLPEFSDPVHVVVVELNLGDVHVQRAPITGTITRMDHFDGDHINALGSEKNTIAATNEKVVSVFKNETTTVAVVQVAGRAARRIRNFLSPRSPITAGQLYGRILLGSQVVIILPQSHPLLVHTGDILTDGETILAQ